jgi:DNA-binding CsgD family transcriptional regulator
LFYIRAFNRVLEQVWPNYQAKMGHFGNRIVLSDKLLEIVKALLKQGDEFAMTHTDQLSKREEEVAELLLKGMSNKEIAMALGISESTVEFHLKNIYAKLHVKSRTEAILKLQESTAMVKPRESTVDKSAENGDNRNEPVLQRQETPVAPLKIGLQEISQFIGKHKIPVLLGMLLGMILIFIFSRPVAWNGYERECEYPDENTVGEMIVRANASATKVHGQFGTVAAWPPKPGYVKYNNINIPRIDQLYLKFRYSKYSPSSVPILIYIDDEPTPRATFYPIDQGSWDQLVWTEPILLGSVRSGVHSLKFFTEGQQYGVADLDVFVLMRKSP